MTSSRAAAPHRRIITLAVGFTLTLLPLAAACGGDSSGPGSSPPPDSVLTLEPVLSGLNVPVYLTAPAGDPRLFIVEKDGRIRIYQNGSLLPTPFLDLTGLTTKGSEQGLLGLAFDPNYATNGRFYVSYTTAGPTPGGTSIIARYHVSAGDPDIANPASDTLILSLAQPETNHNGGGIGFGPDGMLYLGFGDGGGGGDPIGTGQDRTDLLGSMLRLDVSGATYTSPASNPFAASGSFRHELWNYGLRNPWRWSFDRQTGDLYIADVGQNAYEEVNVQAAAGGGGQNYGWNIMEASHCYAAASCNQTGLTLPVITYDHRDGCAVTGGYVYRGSAVPAVQGQYFYSDACSGFIRSFRWSAGTITDQKQWSSLTISGVNSFGEDGQGELYVMTYDGALYRFAAAAPAP
jgi:glucose/arabinose dehydrogenase